MQPGMVQIRFEEHRPFKPSLHTLHIKCIDVRDLVALCNSIDAAKRSLRCLRKKQESLVANDLDFKKRVKALVIARRCFLRELQLKYLCSQIRRKSLCILRKALKTPDELIARVAGGVACAMTRSANPQALLHTLKHEAAITEITVFPDFDNFEPRGYPLAEVDLLMVGF